uniref:Uncharacterized protein n=1 Tax=Meloidogyne floridensis TaxID=298350 RepID=A0A915PEY4_9BILA
MPTTAKRVQANSRINMGKCSPIFGKVTVLVIVVESSYKTHYAVAQRSLECYLRATNYTFKLVDLDHDERTNKYCKHDQLFFKKHCAVAVYLADSDWTLVLDADAGVVNPNHCIEEWIDDRVDLIFYERFFNWEVASGNYLARNSEFSRAFIMNWANMQYTQSKNFSGADNGALQLHILQTVIPGAKAEIKACKKLWNLANNYERYMGYVTCVKTALGATRIWPGKLRILRRGHAWIRDWFLTTDSWSARDFMLHGWKAQNISSSWESPFKKVPVPDECIGGYAGWNWRNEKAGEFFNFRISVEEVRSQLAQAEKSGGVAFPKEGRVLAYLSEPDVGECYPECDYWT